MTQLTSDWLSVKPNASSAPVFPPAKPVPPKFDGTCPGRTEGGGVFERQGKWYLMFGGLLLLLPPRFQRVRLLGGRAAGAVYLRG